MLTDTVPVGHTGCLKRHNQKSPPLKPREGKSKIGLMGRPGFEPETSRLKAECSTAELATPA